MLNLPECVGTWKYSIYMA